MEIKDVMILGGGKIGFKTDTYFDSFFEYFDRIAKNPFSFESVDKRFDLRRGALAAASHREIDFLGYPRSNF